MQALHQKSRLNFYYKVCTKITSCCKRKYGPKCEARWPDVPVTPLPFCARFGPCVGRSGRGCAPLFTGRGFHCPFLLRPALVSSASRECTQKSLAVSTIFVRQGTDRSNGGALRCLPHSMGRFSPLQIPSPPHLRAGALFPDYLSLLPARVLSRATKRVGGSPTLACTKQGPASG